jgi:hypothetical protein
MRPNERGLRKETVPSQWEEPGQKWTKIVHYKGHAGLLSQVGTGILKENRHSQGSNVVFRRKLELCKG